MKILLVSLNYAPEPSGIAPYSTGLAEGLAARNHEVRVITGIPHYPEWRNYTGIRRLRSTAVVNGVIVTRLRHYVPPGGTGPRRALMEASFAAGVAMTSWGDPDIVIAVSPSLAATSIAGLRTRQSDSPPLIVWVQDLYSRGIIELPGGGRVTADMVKRFESMVLRSASSVVVIHDRFAKLVNSQLGVPHKSICEVRNWSHISHHSNPILAANVRSRLDWSNRPVVLHCGSMGVKQGLKAVVAAARHAESEGRDLLFVLMGDGSQRRKLEELAEGCKSIQMLSSLPEADFRAALEAADILLLNEQQGVKEMALPSKLTTYFAAGKPIVAAVAHDGTSADEIRAAEAGIVVAPGDGCALLAAIDGFLADPEQAARMGRSGQRYAARTLTEEGVLTKWEELLEAVVSQHSVTVTGE